MSFPFVLALTSCYQSVENPIAEFPVGSEYTSEVEFPKVSECLTEVEFLTQYFITHSDTISTGFLYSATISSDGSLWVWGRNGRGSLGLGYDMRGEIFSPMQIGTDTDWASVTTGTYTVAIKTDGSLWAWGINSFGQLGDGTITTRCTPIQIGTDTDWVRVTIGGNHTVAIKEDGSLWSWGRNSFSQIGDGTTIDQLTPVQIGTDTDWVRVTAGSDHTMALRADGSIWAWGRNTYYQFGDGITPGGYRATPQSTPLQIGTDTDWAFITTGERHTAAIKTDGSLWTWGWNWFGQLGDGTTVNQPTPVQIGTDIDWVYVAVDVASTIALKSDGTLWTWGANDDGQLGDGTTIHRHTPVQIGTDTDWVSIARNNGRTLAVKTDGSLWSWGWAGVDGASGLIGDGTTESRHSPVRIMDSVLIP